MPITHPVLHGLLARQQRRHRLLLAALLLALVAIWLLSLSLGAFPIWSLSSDDAMGWQVFWSLRLPRTLLAMAVGAALAMSGATLQVLLHNPVAEPGLLGISSGAGMAAMLVLQLAATTGLPLSPVALTVASFAGAMLVTGLLVRLAHRQRLDMARLLLLGIAISIIANAVMTWLMYFASDVSLRQFMFWMMGSLANGSEQLPWSLPTLLLAGGLLIWRAPRLQLLMLGESQARLMGLEVARERGWLISLVCLLTALSVSLCGVIGFVGLVVPHLLRLCGISSPRILLPASALGGALLLLLADLISRIGLSSGELPVGVVTATLGAPIFITLLLKHHAER